ncbi:MAG: hypothetical protein BZ135_01395 [Methanosphaera sp. rholeuAM6]|nr:MAG: hypothetical protein BZ135_01395 [Methanosphaera sp. rholeuAM6]
MVMDITKSILRSLLVNQEVGTIISSKKFNKLQIWKEEVTPYLEKLQNMGYIDSYRKSMGIKFKILKPISLNTISNL